MVRVRVPMMMVLATMMTMMIMMALLVVVLIKVLVVVLIEVLVLVVLIKVLAMMRIKVLLIGANMVMMVLACCGCCHNGGRHVWGRHKGRMMMVADGVMMMMAKEGRVVAMRMACLILFRLLDFRYYSGRVGWWFSLVSYLLV